jgi:hypothetical protein
MVVRQSFSPSNMSFEAMKDPLETSMAHMMAWRARAMIPTAVLLILELSRMVALTSYRP